MGTEPEPSDHDAHVKRRAIYRKLFADMAVVVKRSVAEQRRINHTNGIPESPPEPVVRAVSSRRVNDPLLTDAEYIHQRSKRPDDPLVGKVWVASNELTRIGALAHIRRALDHHKRAAEWFKNAYEALYGGLSPAIDLGKVRVDTSIMAHDNGAVARLDRGKALQLAMDELGKEATDRIVACVVLCIPCEDFADTMPSGQRNQRQVAKATDALLDALERVAEIRGLKMKGRAA